MNIKLVLKKAFYRSKSQIIKYSPEILMATGVVAATGGVIFACKATLKVEAVLDEHADKIEKIKQDIIFAHSPEGTVPYSQEEVNKDVAIAKLTTGVELVKLYLPSATMFVGGIVCILSAHNILKRRNVALVAAYKAVEESFARYRQNVIDDQGDEKDLEYRTGLKKKMVTTTKDGKKVTEAEYETSGDYKNKLSMYARIFEKGNRRWSASPATNLMWLNHTEAYFNDLLLIRGHVMLNEVYEYLGFEQTSAGAVVGWVLKKGKECFIDFGIYEIRNSKFVNGNESAVVLDFNVDGVVYEYIDKTFDYHNKMPSLGKVIVG